MSHFAINQKERGAVESRAYSKRALRHFFYTLAISAAIAVFLSFAGIGDSIYSLLVISESFGISTWLLVHLALRLVKPRNTAAIAATLVFGVTGGTLVGLRLGLFLLGQLSPGPVAWTFQGLLQAGLFAIAFGAAVSYFFFSKNRLQARREEIQQERIMRLSKEKEALEARLKLLQAQIEPHFLFNTLSTILSLIDTTPERGKAMLVDLIVYLRTSLSRTRHERMTLNQEVEIVQAYLNILKIRMGERLRFSIEVQDHLGELPFPPMLLQPLVENAVQHGLEPQIEGGEIRIRVCAEKGLIRAEIVDNGVGFAASSEAGVGLGNVRERLRLLYGEGGRLILEAVEPSGVRAVIEIPREGGDRHEL